MPSRARRGVRQRRVKDGYLAEAHSREWTVEEAFAQLVGIRAGAAYDQHRVPLSPPGRAHGRQRRDAQP